MEELPLPPMANRITMVRTQRINRERKRRKKEHNEETPLAKAVPRIASADGGQKFYAMKKGGKPISTKGEGQPISTEGSCYRGNNLIPTSAPASTSTSTAIVTVTTNSCAHNDIDPLSLSQTTISTQDQAKVFNTPSPISPRDINYYPRGPNSDCLARRGDPNTDSKYTIDRNADFFWGIFRTVCTLRTVRNHFSEPKGYP